MILYGLMSLTTNDHTAMIFSLIGQVFINQISPALYCLSVYFLGLKSQRIPALLSPFVGLFIVCFLRTIEIHKIVHYWWGTFNLYGGWDMPVKLGIYFLMFFGFMLASFLNLLWGYKRETNPLRQLQIRYLILSLSIAYLASWDHLPIMGIGVYPFGYIPLTIFTAIVFYAITKHQFLDIRIAIKRISLASLIYVFLLFISIAATFPILRTLLKNPSFSPPLIVLGLGVMMGAIISLGSLIYTYFVRNSYWLRGHVTEGLTHELKSPLTAIQSAIDVMSEELSATTLDRTRANDYVDMIKKNTSRLENYVHDLLNMAKIQDEHISMEKIDFNLSSVAGDVCDSYKPVLNKKKVNLITEISPDIQIVGDPSKIRQVFSNLLSNAVKFSDKGEVQVSLQKNGREIICRVTDSGIGIDKKDLRRIFDRFYQATPNTRGSGIGLTIAKAWVEAHGGHIWAESEGKGKGTKVIFTLPK
jgi:signal transduction histidine kinase